MHPAFASAHSVTRISSRSTPASSRRASTRRCSTTARRSSSRTTTRRRRTRSSRARSLRRSPGLASIFDNLGSIRNQGMEVTLNNRLIENNEFGFELQLTGSSNKNKILSLGEGVTPICDGQSRHAVQRAGLPALRHVGQARHVQRQERRRHPGRQRSLSGRRRLHARPTRRSTSDRRSRRWSSRSTRASRCSSTSSPSPRRSTTSRG